MRKFFLIFFIFLFYAEVYSQPTQEYMDSVIKTYRKSKRELLKDTSLFVTHFDGSYTGLLMNYWSTENFSGYNQGYAGNNSRDQYNKSAGGYQLHYLSFSNGKYLKPKIAKQYFALVPKANRQYKMFIFFSKMNRVGLYGFLGFAGVSTVLFFAWAPETDGGKWDREHKGLLMTAKIAGISTLSSLILMTISAPLTGRHLKKAVKRYNESINNKNTK